MRTVWLAALALAAVALSGCTDLGPGGDGTPTGTPTSSGPGGGSGFAPQEHHAENASEDLDGVRVDGELYECDAGLCIDARGHNEGQTTYQVSSICVGPWEERMEQDGDPVPHREPMAHCLAFGTRDWVPGETLHFNVTWNSTVWDGERYESAPQGAYDWIVTLVVYEEADGAGRHDIDVLFPVFVGPT